MVIIKVTSYERPDQYFRGPGEAPWSTDREDAAAYPDEVSAQADLAKLSFVYIHYLSRAQVIPA